MSIIEKAADMLEPAPQLQREPAAPDREADTLEPGLIERAVSHKSERADFPGDKDLAEKSKAGPAPASGRVARILKVDPDRLRAQSMITPDGERTPIAEAFRRIKRHVLANAAKPEAGAGTNLVMVTSPLAGEGKTFCAINLAISIAMEMDRTVLLVDADVAKPAIPAVLGLEAEKGLMDVLLERRLELADVLCKTDIDTLTILPAGTRHHRATELLASEMMRALLQEMAERYYDRIIIFDSPPLLVASEAGVLASRMGQIVVVVEAGKTTEAALKDALGRIESCKVVGLLLNKGEGPGLGYYYAGFSA